MFIRKCVGRERGARQFFCWELVCLGWFSPLRVLREERSRRGRVRGRGREGEGGGKRGGEKGNREEVKGRGDRKSVV